jgi:RNA polymerase sigma-70 factor (ECF subfamily)
MIARAADTEDDAGALVERARAGDVSAFECLYRREAGRIHALCLRLCGDTATARTLTHDAFARAWEKLPGFRGDAAFATWLHRVAVNVVLGDRRTQLRRVAREQDTAAHDEVEAMARVDAGLDLERAIAMLPAQARMVFVLFEIEGLGHDEIAECMNVAVGTSKAQLHRARELLRRALA